MGRYRIVGDLGRGGMGVVYRAEDERLGRSVALKFLPTHLRADSHANERLMVEARAAAALDHPNVCAVYEVAETEDGRAYIAFACYDGQTLAERLENGPLTIGEAVRIAGEVAAGLAAAHARDIVHRDLKPSNVFLTEDGTAKILDFGIARMRGVALTAPGATPGTVEYGAPETARGRADERSDVWSLGVVLHEMLTGRRPFHAPYQAAVLYAVLHEAPPPPSALNPAVPPELDAVVAQCLAKDPDDRYPDAAAVAEALAPAGGPDDLPAVVRQAGRALVRRLRRSRAWQAGAAAALALLAAAVLGVFRPAEPPTGLPEEMVLAVLAPTTTPDTPDENAFARGLADDLTSGLARHAGGVPGLSVIPYTDVRSEGVETARQARAELGANLVVEGSLHHDDRQVRLVLTLVRPGARRSEVVTSTEIALGRADGSRLRTRALQALLAMLGATPPAGLDTAGQTADPDAWELYVKGLGYLRRDQEARDVDRAITLFGLAIGEDSAFASARAGLGEAYLAKYETTKDSAWVGRARAEAERAQDLDPRSPDVHITLSKLYRTTGQYPLATHHARQALSLDPASFTASLALAATQEASADIEGAEETLRDAMRQSSSPRAKWAGPSELGLLYLRQARYDEAVVQLQRVVERVPGSYRSHLNLGGARQLAGDAAGARAAYAEAVRLRPDDYAAYSNLGTLLLLVEEDAPGAVRRYRQALARDSSDHYAWRNLASAYSEMGKESDRRAALRGAIRRAEADLAVNPNDPDVLAAVATYHEAVGNVAAALDAARRAVELAPGDPLVQYDAARVLAGLGRSDAALDALAAATNGGHGLAGVSEDRAFASLRGHPRFRALVRNH